MIESAATGVEQLRPRKDRSHRRAVIRIGSSALVVGVLVVGVMLLLLGPMSTFPATTYAANSTITLTSGDRTAVVPVGEGWTRLGVIPAADRADLVSPDGRYELTVRLLPADADSKDQLDAIAGDLEPLDGAGSWKTETSTSDVTARHLDFVDGGSVLSVVGVSYPDATTLILEARVAEADADRYRPLTAAIVGELGSRG